MKQWFIMAMITLLFCGFMGVVFAESQEFEIVNSSDSDLYDLAIRPSDSANWGPNVLPKGVSLKAGQRIHIAFSNYDANIEHWDILSHDCCRAELIWHKLRLNSIHTIILHEDDKVELN